MASNPQKTYIFDKYKPYTLTVGGDGTFVVKSGDMISKYNWAIHGCWGTEKTTWPDFGRIKDGKLITITNYNLIETNETLAYRPLYTGDKPKNGNGGKPGSGGGQPGTHPPETSGPPVNLDQPGSTGIVPSS